jgi:DNA-binding NtrC family response regulator
MTKHRVLIVEDEPDIAALIKHALERTGEVEPEIVTSGDAALKAVADNPPALILLDLNLRGENGLDLLALITKERPGIPIVMVTAQGGIDSAVEAMRRGAIDFLEKPFTRQQFLTVLARVQRFRQLGQKIEGLETRVREVLRSVAGGSLLRIDSLHCARDGAFVLMELELIEPNLFLEFAAGSAERLGEAIARRLNPRERQT